MRTMIKYGKICRRKQVVNLPLKCTPEIFDIYETFDIYEIFDICNSESPRKPSAPLSSLLLLVTCQKLHY